MKRNTIISVIVIMAIIVTSILLFWKPEKLISKSQPQSSVVKLKPPALNLKKQELKKDIEALHLRFSPKNGQILVYKFEIQTNADVDFGFLLSRLKMDNIPQNSITQKSHIILKASGELCLKFHDLDKGLWNVAAFIEGLTYHLNNTTPAYAKTLEFPFTFKMNTAGYINSFYFVEGVPNEAKGFIRQLFYTLQTGLPSEEKINWRTREIDTRGTYLAEYNIEDTSNAQGISLLKRKLKYTEVKSTENIPMAKIRIENSRNTISVPRNGAWLLAFEGEEASSSKSKGSVWGQSTGRCSLHQVSKDISGKFPDSFDNFLSDMNSQKYKKSKYYITDEKLNELGANLDIKDALAKYLELKNSNINNGRSFAAKFLVNYLRQNPQASFDLVNVIDNDPKREQYDQSTQLILWRLLTEAGHTEAQQAVIEAATDPKYSSLTHIRAVAYIHDFENPEPFLAEKLLELHKNLPPDPDNQDNRDLKAMSLYAVGSLGYKDKLNDEIKPEIGKHLTENLKNTDNPGEQAITLSAIGNYGNSEVLNDIAPYFSSSDERVRASAYDALRRMDDPKAVKLLAESVKKEESVKVRQTAYAVFAAMPATSAGIEWAKTEVFKVDNPKEQEPLVKVIGKNLKKYPQNEQTLRDLLKKDLDNRVKKEIYKYILP